MSPLEGLLLGFLGLGVGTYASIIGAGGGFLLMPVLLLVFPDETPAALVSISLAVVLFNALSSSVNYARYRRIDYSLGLLFVAAIVPGAFLGSWLTHFVVRGPFDVAFGLLLLGLAAFLVFRPVAQHQEGGSIGRGNVTRTFVDAQGVAHTYSFSRELGLTLSFAEGIVSALMGIGGGVILVPICVKLLHFPPQVATSTSLFIIIFMSLAATATHLAAGDFTGQAWQLVAALAIGIVLGAQVGSRLSQRLRSQRIMQLLSLALVIGGVRLILEGVGV